MGKKKGLLKAAVLFVLAVFIAGFAAPFNVKAEEKKGKTVRVGVHEAPFFITDKYGRKSGYSYEYLRKIAAYAGWTYEYIEGSWSELLEKLKKGEIDLMSDVSLSEERKKDMLFSSLPMGTEAYYIYVTDSNQDITSKNLSSLNGNRIGVGRGSIQKDMFVDWAASRGISAEIIEMSCSVSEALNYLGTKYDAFITMDVYATNEKLVPVFKLGSSPFYFAVTKSRPDLLEELDNVLNMIQDENKYYDQQLHDKYLKNAETKKYLNSREKEWLAGHGKIRVGYQDNYLAFCAKDPATGKLTGALKDYLDYAALVFENAHIEFEPVAYPTASEAIEAMKRGEVDCVFPANLTDYDAEQLGILMSPALMTTEMNAVVRASEQKEFLRKDKIVVAVNEGNTNYDMFLADHYPKWERTYFKNTPAGLEAIADGKADCVIISSYRFSNISKQCEKLHLATVYTGVNMDYCFAVSEGDTILYSILSKAIGVVPEGIVHSALTYYSTEDVKTSFGDIIKDNLFIILTVIAVILFIIVLLLLHNIRANKTILEKEDQVKDLNRKANVDQLTQVRNKSAYNEYIKKLQEQLDRDDVIDLAIGIFDCNDVKSINEQYGHDNGDIYIKNACLLICKVFAHSPVFRIGNDKFAAILMNNDFTGREELIALLGKKQEERNAVVKSAWKRVNVAYGIAVYDHELDDELLDTAARAEKSMHDNKRKMKSRK